MWLGTLTRSPTSISSLRGHALTIAGRLNEESDKFTNVCDQLKEEGESIPHANPSKSRTASRIAAGVVDLMAGGGEDNKICAAYCIDIAFRVEESFDSSEELKDILSTLEGESITPNWDDTLGAPIPPGKWPGPPRDGTFEEREEVIPGGDAEKFATNTSKVFGLVVVTLGSGKQAGSASSITAAAIRDEAARDKIRFQLNQKVGDMMGNSLESIAKFLQVTYGEGDLVPKGYTVDIIFEDKDQLTDGPSAGTAMALLLETLFTGKKLDEGFACTGGITNIGDVTSIGGVAAKIRGATRRNCNIVGVPEGNSDEVADILVLGGIKQLLDIQIFSMKNIEQARQIAHEEKSPEVMETLAAFNDVAAVVKEALENSGEDGAQQMLANPAVQDKLKAVIEKMDNHLSAKLLLDLGEGHPVEHLSVGGSLHEVRTSAAGVFQNAGSMTWREKYDHSKAVQDSAQEAIDSLENLDGKIDDRLEEYHSATLKLSKLVLEGKGDDDEEVFLKRLSNSLENVQTIYRKLLDDPEIREELMG